MGKGSSSPTSTTVTNNALPSYAEPYYKDLMAKAQAVSESPYQAYTGGRLAGFSGDTQNAYQGFRDMQERGTPGLNQAQRGINQSQYDPYSYQMNNVGPSDQMGSAQYDSLVNRYMNPYLDQVLGAQKSAANLDYGRQKSDRNAQYIKAGAFGGSRQAVADYLGEEGLLNRMAGIDAAGYNQAWNQASGAALDSQRYNIDTRLRSDLANQDTSLRTQQLQDQSNQFDSQYGLQRASALGSLEGQRYDLNNNMLKNVLGIGQDYQQQAQTALDLQYENFINQRDYPRQNIQFMSGVMNGVPSSVNQSVSNGIYQSPMSSLMGAGITGLALQQLMGQGGS